MISLDSSPWCCGPQTTFREDIPNRGVGDEINSGHLDGALCGDRDTERRDASPANLLERARLTLVLRNFVRSQRGLSLTDFAHVL